MTSFGQHGYAFIYRLNLKSNRKFLARFIHNFLVGTIGDEGLCRIYEPEFKRIEIVRLSDFRTCKQEELPRIHELIYVPSS